MTEQPTRWTKSTIYPDMWADPDEDPRDNNAEPLPKIYGDGDGDFDGLIADQGEVDAALTRLAREQAETDAALAGHTDLGERLGKDQIAVRELYVHRIEEYARNCGHAGLLRECIDGRVGQ
ncbi:DUF664 domain-containing protein [Arthrobacter alpinus]|uniref:mycothiol transferase n=1 Tax=Arthrobacter alpinus TaxID=656366 RepID=UPI0005C829EE|nr:DUF664 domain-containing protein [Arthrobacter alpinus]